MTDSTENVDNEYVLTAIVTIRGNSKRPDTKAIKYINKNSATDVEEELIGGIVMELLDHNIIENRLTPKQTSYFIRKKNNTPVDVIWVKTTPEISEYDLVNNTDLTILP